ncbi:MAG: recombination protein RecR [Clostridiales bacterium]|nr:recombination protein RecR [Clostridiales bacterium]
MRQQVEPIQRMADELAKLPGIGRKSAQRLAYHLAATPIDQVRALAKALEKGREDIKLCTQCGNYTADERCAVCADYKRRQDILCVVRDPRDVAAMERMHDYHGLYHVLHGILSPMDGIGPSDIRISELMRRLESGTVKEIILATNPDIEGEATASYIARLVKPLGVRVTRIAHGVPVGSDLEYTDEVTLSKAMEGRREI